MIGKPCAPSSPTMHVMGRWTALELVTGSHVPTFVTLLTNVLLNCIHSGRDKHLDTFQTIYGLMFVVK